MEKVITKICIVIIAIFIAIILLRGCSQSWEKHYAEVEEEYQIKRLKEDALIQERFKELESKLEADREEERSKRKY